MTDRQDLSLEVRKLSRHYKDLGYEVPEHAAAADVPFDLGNYSPDLVARMPDQSGGVIVEFKKSADSISVDRLGEIARHVNQHPGWRFVLVTLDDIKVAKGPEYIPHWQEIRERIKFTNELRRLKNIDPAILYLYATFEAAMRRLALEEDVPVERLQSTRIRNSLYTAGLLDGDQFALSKAFLAMRNKAAHGFEFDRNLELFRRFERMVSAMVESWSVEPARSSSLSRPKGN